MDTTLLYGEMAGSWLLHLAAPLVIATVLGLNEGLSQANKVSLLLLITVIVSFCVQFGFLTFLQASACTGVKSYYNVFKGALVAALFTAIMVAIPLYWEKARLMVSQLFLPHQTMLTPEQAAQNDILVKAAEMITTPQKGGALDAPGYDAQTFKEITYGAAYWAAFAGAYGVGAGSLSAAKCPATK